MSDQGKEQPASLELDDVTAIKNFIEANKTPLTSGLVNLVQLSRIVLLGNIHSFTYIEGVGERWAMHVTNVLPVLKAQGGLTGVAVELDSILQQRVEELDPDDPNLEVIIANIVI